MKTFTTFSLILLSTSTYVNALPLAVGNFTVPLIRLESTGAYLKGAANASRARARFLKSRTPVGPSTMSMLSSAPYFVVEVGVGSEPVVYQHLLVDTGSSLTWLEYTESSTSKLTGQELSNVYGGGTVMFKGNEYLDKVTLAPGLAITNQLIGSVSPSRSIGLADFHGILGLARVDRLDPNPNGLIQTVMNNLMSQELITEEVFSVYIPPITSATQGKLTYGGINKSLYEGKLTYFPLTKTYPASKFWGIDLSSCTYGTDTITPTPSGPPIVGVVDTGSPTILIPDDLFGVYMNTIPGAKYDMKTGLIEIPPSSIQRMQPLHFTIGNREFTLDVDSQLLPQEMYTAWGVDAGKCYSRVGFIGHGVGFGHGVDFVFGIPFMEKFYTVHDADRQRIGFARVYVLVMPVVGFSQFKLELVHQK